MFMAWAALFSLVGSGCSGGSNNPLLIVATATPTQTPAPTATTTPIPISATQAGTGLALADIEASGKTLWTSNRAWLRRLLDQFKATPGLRQASKTSLIAAVVAKQVDDALLQIAGANLVGSPDDTGLPPASSPKIRKGISTLALDLHNFETNGVYGDTRDELPRANCDFTTNPKGNCTPSADTLTIRFNDPVIGKNLTTFFDWTGASTGKSSPTVQAHDPLNPGTIVEIPTRLVLQLQANGTTLLNAVIDIQWLASPCVTGKFLFDIPVSADLTGFIVGADLVTQILNGTASANLSATSGTGTGNVTGMGGGKSITASASASADAAVARSAKSCGAFENVVVSSFVTSGSVSNGPHEFDLSLSGNNLVTGAAGVLQSAQLDGNFFADRRFGTFSGTMDDNTQDCVPGHDLIIHFVDFNEDFADFIIDFLGVVPHKPRSGSCSCSLSSKRRGSLCPF